MKNLFKTAFITAFAVMAIFFFSLITPTKAYAVPPSGSFTNVTPTGCVFPCSVNISWSASGGTTYYIVHGNSSPVSEFPGTIVASGGPVSVSLPNGDNTFVLYVDTTPVASVTITNTPPTPTPTPPVAISNLSVNKGQGDATITWTTSIPSDSSVDYGTSTSYGSNVNKTALETSHSLYISSLNAGTTYHFVARSRSGDQTSTSGDQVFMTNTGSSGGSSGSSSPTATPAPQSNPTATPRPAGSGSGGTTPTSATSPTPEEGVLGATESAITSTPADKKSDTDKQATSSASVAFFTPLTIAVTGIAGVFIVLSSLVLQAAGVINIGFLDKIIRFIFRA